MAGRGSRPGRGLLSGGFREGAGGGRKGTGWSRRGSSARRPDSGPAPSAPARACAVRGLWLPPRTSRTASRTSRDLHLRPRSALAATHPRPGYCHLQGQGVGRTCGWPGDPTNGCCVKWAVFWGTEPFSPCLLNPALVAGVKLRGPCRCQNRDKKGGLEFRCDHLYFWEKKNSIFPIYD